MYHDESTIVYPIFQFLLVWAYLHEATSLKPKLVFVELKYTVDFYVYLHCYEL